jgi:hypothetical protein
MTLPSFSAERALGSSRNRHSTTGKGAVGGAARRPAGTAIVPSRRIGGSTLPKCRITGCRSQIEWEVCGSSLPGYPPPMCQTVVTVCDNVCCYSNGACGTTTIRV